MEQNPPNTSPDAGDQLENPSEPKRLSQKTFAEFVEILATSGFSLIRAESSSSGPLPSPEILEKYKQISPDLYNFIVREFGEEGPHRRKNEERLISNGILMARLGLLSALLITVLFLGAGFYLILHGHDVAGASICGAGLVSVVIAFLRHTSSQSRGK